MDITKRTCGECIYFQLVAGSKGTGHCYCNPPLVFPAGFCGRPTIGRHDRACSHFSPNEAVMPKPTSDDPKEIVARAIESKQVTPYTGKPPPKYAPRFKRTRFPEAAR